MLVLTDENIARTLSRYQLDLFLLLPPPSPSPFLLPFTSLVINYTILMSINESIVRASYKCYILNLLNSLIYPSKYMMSIMINNGIVRTPC